MTAPPPKKKLKITPALDGEQRNEDDRGREGHGAVAGNTLAMSTRKIVTTFTPKEVFEWAQEHGITCENLEEFLGSFDVLYHKQGYLFYRFKPVDHKEYRVLNSTEEMLPFDEQCLKEGEVEVLMTHDRKGREAEESPNLCAFPVAWLIEHQHEHGPEFREEFEEELKRVAPSVVTHYLEN